MPSGPPDISAYRDLLRPIGDQGPSRFIYAYVDEQGRCPVEEFLDELKRREPKAWSRYRVAMTMLATQGRATGDKCHVLDPKRPPAGILKDKHGNKHSLSEMGEFKNTDHQSRIFYMTEPGGVMILLSVFTKKKENELTAEAINPALKARDEYRERKAQRLARRR